MADNIEITLLEHPKSIWRSIFTVVKDSIVYMDDSIAEILHWSGQTLDLIDAGAKNIKSIDCGESGGKDDKKAVFISSSLLQGNTVEKLKNIIQSSHFQHCSIFSTISDANHAMALKEEHNMENDNFFAKFKKTVEFWMNNMYATVDIRHIPFISANIVPGLFFMPSFSSFFPILPSDVPIIQDCLRTKGDQRNFNSLSEVELRHMPQVFQVKLKLLASALSDLFEVLDLSEDCYGIGHTAKMLASEVSNLSAAKKKKAGGGYCSVIFVDRTLDLVQSSSHSACTLADKIFGILPKLPGHTVDVMVDMSSICGLGDVKPNIIVPGSLAHDSSNKQTQGILNSMFREKLQVSLSEIRHELLEVVKGESLTPAKESDVGKVTAEKLLSLMECFRNNLDVFLKHSALLQLAMAAINSLQHENNSQLQELQCTEKVLQLSLNEDDSPSCLSHILTMLKNVIKGTRSYYFEDIIMLILFVYSLVGEDSLDSLEEEDQLKEAIINNVLARTLKVKTNLIIDNETDGEDVIRCKIAKCFERLSGIRNLREDLILFKHVFTLSSPTHDVLAYEPILKQIMSKVFDPKKPEISDIEFKSTKLKDYIKSGFSLFMNVHKPHPSDHPVLFIFIVGGVTSSEVQQIDDILITKNIKTKVIIGSTKIMNFQDTLRSFFSQNNIFSNTF